MVVALGGDSINILDMKLGTKLGAILGPILGARPNIVPSFEPNFVPKMSIESPPYPSLLAYVACGAIHLLKPESRLRIS